MAFHSFGRNNRSLEGLLPDLSGNYPKICSHYFASVADMADYIAPRPKTRFWLSDGFDETPWRIEFYGNTTWQQALDMARDGWKDGAERVATLRDRINASRPEAPRLARWDVAGSLPSVPRYLAGNPLSMRRAAPMETKRKPVLTLVANFAGNCDVSADSFINRAAVIAATIDAIESAGFSIHLIGAALTRTSDKKMIAEIGITLKEPGQSVDIASVAYGLGHAALFRRLCFAVWGGNLEYRPLGKSLGNATSYPKGNGDCLILPAIDSIASLFQTENDAATRGMESTVIALARQGCPAFREHSQFNLGNR